MCRILAIKSKHPFEISEHLHHFAAIAKESKEYQGHGWGLSYLDQDQWVSYHDIKPIWEDNLDQFGSATTLLVHARSAFQDEGIAVENNMPFIHEDLVFIFNGELRGVKIREDGRIGAEKIFNFVERFRKYGIRTALDRAIPIIDRRTEYIRALNFVIADKEHLYISNYFNEDPDYFNLHLGRSRDTTIICSQPYVTQVEWMRLDNYGVEVI